MKQLWGAQREDGIIFCNKIWRKSDPGRGHGECKGPEAVSVASTNETVAELESVKGEGEGRGQRGGCWGGRGGGREPGHVRFYKGCVFFSRIRTEATGGFVTGVM